MTRHLLVSYTEGFAIQYLERNLRPYWERNHQPVEEMLDTAESQYSSLDKRGNDLDEELTADLTKAGGEHYAAIAILAYRQTLAAHKLVADVNGDPMLFAKENFSNGCIATVDVLYPSAPFFLFLQPRLLEAQLRPVLEYSALARWKFPFSPHDLGQYPLANGQVYGGGEKTEEDQMPVEESGNMIILTDALARAEGNAKLAEQYWPQLTKWAEYLKEKGLDPENQLTTDDFAGHVAHNSNLSIKAIDALAAYADLAHLLKQDGVAQEYAATAKAMAGKWVGMAQEGDHYKLAFNSPGTWSQKYNLVWDVVLDYNLFPKNVRDNEMTYYLTKVNRYGLPLDSRADYTKLDWSIWTATLTSNPEQFKTLINPIYKWINETPSRVPLTDWYDTKTGKQIGFQARSVVGGVFIKALSDKQLTEKWRTKEATSSNQLSRRIRRIEKPGFLLELPGLCAASFHQSYVTIDGQACKPLDESARLRPLNLDPIDRGMRACSQHKTRIVCGKKAASASFHAMADHLSCPICHARANGVGITLSPHQFHAQPVIASSCVVLEQYRCCVVYSDEHVNRAVIIEVSQRQSASSHFPCKGCPSLHAGIAK